MARGRRPKPAKQEDDELWLVSYADMVTLLLGFFIILYSMSTIDQEKLSRVTNGMNDALGSSDKPPEEAKDYELPKENRQLKALAMMVSLSQMGGMDKFVEKMENKEKRQAAVEVVKDLLDDESLESDEDVLNIVIPSKFLFESGKASIGEEAFRDLAPVADRIKKAEGLVDVAIEGHTDSSPVTKGIYPDNWALSAARAGVVAASLQRYGVPVKYLRPYGLADSAPLFPEKRQNGLPIYENMAKNRRVSIILKSRKGAE